MASRSTRSLAVVCTVYTALVIASATLVYAVYQYFSTPELTAWRVAITHGWHVLAYAALVYLTLSLVLYRKVIRPIRQLNVKLYAITRGDLSHLPVESSVEEIREIAEVVNFLVHRMEESVPGVPISELSSSGRRLRALAHELDMLDAAVKENMVSIANRMDEVVERLTSDELQRRAREREEESEVAEG